MFPQAFVCSRRWMQRHYPPPLGSDHQEPQKRAVRTYWNAFLFWNKLSPGEANLPDQKKLEELTTIFTPTRFGRIVCKHVFLILQLSYLPGKTGDVGNLWFLTFTDSKTVGCSFPQGNQWTYWTLCMQKSPMIRQIELFWVFFCCYLCGFQDKMWY